jgi:hypothetical protein
MKEIKTTHQNHTEQLQREVEKVMKELTQVLIDPLEEARKRLERAQQALNQQMARMQAELAKQTADPHYQIPLGVYLDYGNAKNEYAVAEKEYKRLQREQVKSHGETVEALKAQYRELAEAERKARNGSEDEWKAAKANLDKARRALNKEGVSTLTIEHGPLNIDHSPLTIDHSPLTIRKKHKKVRTSGNVSKPISTEEQIAQKIARLREQTEAADIKAMEDETERKVKQLEHDRAVRLAAIERTHDEILRLRGGNLTETEEAVFAEAREHAYMVENKKLDTLLRERLQKEAKALETFDMKGLQASLDWDDVFSDIGRHSTVFLADLRSKLEEALNAKGITEANAQLLREKIDEITEQITSRGNVWESLLPNLGLRKQLERALKEARERGDAGKASSLEDKLGQMGGWKDVFGFLSGSPLEIIEGVNTNIQSLGDLVDTMGLGGSAFGEAVHQFAEGSASFTGAVSSLASGDVVGALNGVVKGFQSWGKLIGIGNGGNVKEVARVTERNTQSNERLTQAVERLKETMDRQNGASAVNTFQAALADQRRIIEQTMEILMAQMGYHGAHHSNAKKFNLGDEAYTRISALLGRNVNSLDSLYALTPEEMDEIRTKLTDIWASILSQGDYDKSEYWERYADLAGTIEELTEQINENLTQTSFQSLRDDFVSTLMDMDADASDFSDRFAEMMQRSLLNMVVGNTIDKELEAWYGSWAERLQSGTLTTSEIARYKSEYDALVARGLAQRDQIAQLTGYESSSREAEGTKGSFRSMSQEMGSELSGRFTAIQLQTMRLSDIVERQSEDVARIAATSNDTYTLMGEMNDVVWHCSQYLETIAKNSGYLPSMDRNIARMRSKIDSL